MADIRVPVQMGDMTFTVSGLKTPVNRIVSGITPAEATALVSPRAGRSVFMIFARVSTGFMDIRFPPGLLTNITINGTGIAVDANGLCAFVNAPSGTRFLGNTDAEPFQLVQG